MKALLDAAHEAAMERACALDRRYFAEHPDELRYVRSPVDHEVCIPGAACQRIAGYLVDVVQFAPGLRARALVPAGARA